MRIYKPQSPFRGGLIILLNDIIRLVLPVSLFVTGIDGGVIQTDDDIDGKLQVDSLDLYCHEIPNHQDQLCLIKTESPYGPYDEVVFYRKDKSGAYSLIDMDKGSGVASFGSLSFSADGKYLWYGWYDEGHPSVYFYETKVFLEVGTQQGVDAVHEYELDHIDGITKDGKLIYGFWKEMPECHNTELYEIVIDPESCHHVVELGALID